MEQPQQKKEEMNGQKLILNPFFNADLRTNPDSKDDTLRINAMFDKIMDAMKDEKK
jgi:hypothetical protein